MSRSAGTLTTTHNATYLPPRLMPGYKGHCPSLKFDYGETYGNATAKYFQDYRSTTLQCSASPYAKGGQFPTYYTHDPTLVISNRSRNRDKYLGTPKYELTNYDHDRNEELKLFDRQSQHHRDFYTDKSGTLAPVNAFLIPNKAEDLFNKTASYALLTKSCDEGLTLPRLNLTLGRLCLINRPKRTESASSTARDRSMRDVYFEKR